jgi:predicted kinase
MQPPTPQLIIICGLSFSGKSTLARAIVLHFGFAEVDVDETKFNLFGRAIQDSDLKPADWARLYAETDREIAELLTSGKTVVDASRNFSKTERDSARQIAENCGVALLTVYVDTPESVARQRLLDNRVMPSRRDVSDSDFADVIRAMQVPTADESPLVFEHTGESEDWLAEHARSLAGETDTSL